MQTNIWSYLSKNYPNWTKQNCQFIVESPRKKRMIELGLTKHRNRLHQPHGARQGMTVLPAISCAGSYIFCTCSFWACFCLLPPFFHVFFGPWCSTIPISRVFILNYPYWVLKSSNILEFSDRLSPLSAPLAQLGFQGLILVLFYTVRRGSRTIFYLNWHHLICCQAPKLLGEEGHINPPYLILQERSTLHMTSSQPLKGHFT